MTSCGSPSRRSRAESTGSSGDQEFLADVFAAWRDLTGIQGQPRVAAVFRPVLNRAPSNAKGILFQNVTAALIELYDEALDEQVGVWRAIAQDLQPFNYSQPKIDCDAIARYFDGTSRGFKFMFNFVLRELDKDKADEESLHRLLSAHFGFLQGVSLAEAMERPGFQRFCELVLSAKRRRDVLASFEVAMRFLRIASLLLKSIGHKDKRHKDSWTIYVYDYDQANIEGSFKQSTRRQRRFRHGRWIEQLALERQTPAGKPGSGFHSVDALLFSDPYQKRTGVRWVHAVNPSEECLLAIGQQYHLRVHAMSALTNLSAATPQAEVSKSGTDWSAIVFPASYIERGCKSSFDRYQAWYHEVANAARASSYTGEKLQKELMQMPELRIGIVEVNLMLFWSRTGDNTVISFASEPQFLARWVTPADENPQGWCSWLFGCFGRCCLSRWRGGGENGYKPLPGSEMEASASEARDLEADNCEEVDELDDDDDWSSEPDTAPAQEANAGVAEEQRVKEEEEDIEVTMIVEKTFVCVVSVCAQAHRRRSLSMPPAARGAQARA
mmetsp:Transcript_120886/g.347271  ORF Transcript_120886/g.347271 Transcript_120886/m.347271 type:complete len:555 (-) Transcript_120886:412-2076(-)